MRCWNFPSAAGKALASGGPAIAEPRDLAKLRAAAFDPSADAIGRNGSRIAGLPDFTPARELSSKIRRSRYEGAVNGLGSRWHRRRSSPGELAAGRLVVPIDIRRSERMAYCWSIPKEKAVAAQAPGLSGMARRGDRREPRALSISPQHRSKFYLYRPPFPGGQS